MRSLLRRVINTHHLSVLQSKIGSFSLISSFSNLGPGSSDAMQAPVKINGRRLIETIHSTCEFGKAHRYGEHETETGMARLALNDDDKKVREWLIQQVKAVGCSVTIDQMGNIFAVRPGRNKTAPPVMMGSHLDTQPTGGRYDGILGVLAALEALRTIHESGYQTEGPIGLVNWTNEEGARFPMVTVSSGVWADVVPLETAWNCREVASLSQGSELKTMKQELARIGFLGETPASYKAFPIGAHFELHIEQGPILENEEQKIGVVTAAQAYSWFEITVKGQDCHAGTTPLSARRDPLLAAAKMIAASNQIAKTASGLITTGIFQATPGSINTMAHTIKFTMDIRHPQDEQVSSMVQQCHEAFEKIATEGSERGVEVSWETLTENVAVKFHPDCISAVESAAEAVCASLPASQNPSNKGLWRRMASGAGHDSCNVSKRCPTAMVFTPTRNGMSHTPDEYCSPEDCILGAEVLMGAALKYDTLRAQRGELTP
ncbi:N-carbamoyl-L-amino acid hydrolase [Talaromyces pinophilus]|nr:N-carbamoyl-L-amino acid hydrolase [Talaromyces pinophilus]